MWKQFSMWRARLLVLILIGAGLGLMGWIGSMEAAPVASDHVSDQNSKAFFTAVLTPHAYLPVVVKADPCRVSTGESYGSLEIPDWQSTPPAESHPDLNLALRGYTPTVAFLGLVDIAGPTDPGAPQLAGLLARSPTVTAVYRVYDWLWGCDCRGDPIDDPEVTLMDLAATEGDRVHVPDSGYSISPEYEVLVLYASADRLTLKYTIEDNIGVPPTGGYAIHVENVCVDASLLTLYNMLNSAGRYSLPALRAGQAFGRVRGNHIGVVIRDTGAWMDPRSRKDWWHGY